MNNEWSFSFGWFFGGLLVMGLGALVVIFYQKVANFYGGVSMYEKVKLAGIIIAAIGFIMMTNIISLLGYWFIGLLFNR